MFEALGIIFISLFTMPFIGWLILSSLIGIYIVLTVFEDEEKFLILLTTFFIISCAVSWWNEGAFWNFVANNYDDLIKLAMASYVIGALWTVPKWSIYLNRERTQNSINRSYKLFSGNIISKNDSNEFIRIHCEQTKERLEKKFGFEINDEESLRRAFMLSSDSDEFKAINNKTKIFNWMTFWIFDIIRTFFGDILYKLKEYAFNSLIKIYNSITNSAIDKALK